MGSWEESLKNLEQYIASLNSPRKAIKLREWIKRFTQIKNHPECSSLEELGVAPPYTIDLALLYPRRRRAA